jgi:hypothetical protein
MIKLKDLLFEGKYKIAGKLGIKLMMMLQKWVEYDIKYTNPGVDITDDEVTSYNNWLKRYNYNDVKKFEKKFMKEIYKHLKKEGIKPNNPFVKLHSKMLHSKVFSKGGIIDKQLNHKNAGSAWEDVRWSNVKIIQDKMNAEVKEFYDTIIVMGKV